MPERSGGPRRGAGFSLLEVLVAFAVLALTLGVLLQIFSGSLRNTLTADAYAKAADVAESVLALAGTELPLEPGRQAGSDGVFQWQLTVAPYPAEEFAVLPDRFGAYRVTADVRWGGAGRERRFSLSTLRLAQPGS